MNHPVDFERWPLAFETRRGYVLVMATTRTTEGTELLARFAREAGAKAGEVYRNHVTADAAWRGIAPRVDALQGVGPKTLARLRAVFVAAFEDARTEQVAAYGVDL